MKSPTSSPVGNLRDSSSDSITPTASKRTSPAALAYLKHLHEKQQGVACVDDLNATKPHPLSDDSQEDHRETIVSPLAMARVPEDFSGFFAAPPLSLPQPSFPHHQHPQQHADAATSKGAAARTKAKGKKNKKVRSKPPLCGGGTKHPRSVISDATNSTYLSSDSEEECITVHSESMYSTHSNYSDHSHHSKRSHNTAGSNGSSVSHQSSSQRSAHSGKRTPRSVTSASTRQQERRISGISSASDDSNGVASETCRASSSALNTAIVPYDRRIHEEEQDRSPESMGSEKQSRQRQSRRSTERRGSNEYCHDDAEQEDDSKVDDGHHQAEEIDYLALQYSDNEDDGAYVGGYDNDDDHYHNAHLSHQSQRDVLVDDSDDLSIVQRYPAEDDVGEDLHDDDQDDGLADLDQLILESSVRWKQTVTETVKNTVTASTSANLVSALEESPLLFSAAAAAAPPITVQANKDTTTTNQRRSVTTTSASNLLDTGSNKIKYIIEEQMAEIQALRAALNTHQRQTSGAAPFVPSDNNCAAPMFEAAIDGETSDLAAAPVHQIEVRNEPLSSNDICCYDDLTVWSGFHSAAPCRPDAASVASGPSPAMPGAAATTKIVSGLQLQLASTVTGITRRAVFSGQLVAHHHHRRNDDDTVTGTGVLQFIETGDVYRGEIVDSEMHGRGTYTFASASPSAPNNVLQGDFEHNVYVGE
jgi:hypothetical protein